MTLLFPSFQEGLHWLKVDLDVGTESKVRYLHLPVNAQQHIVRLKGRQVKQLYFLSDSGTQKSMTPTLMSLWRILLE